MFWGPGIFNTVYSTTNIQREFDPRGSTCLKRIRTNNNPLYPFKGGGKKSVGKDCAHDLSKGYY